MEDKILTWGEIRKSVYEELGPDGEAQGSELMVARWLRAGAVDLLNHVPRMKMDDSRNYSFSDIASEGHASYGSLPCPGSFREIFTVRADHENGEPAEKSDRWFYSLFHRGWEGRHDLISGRTVRNGRFYVIGPDGRDFYIYPGLVDPEEHPDKARIIIVHFEPNAASFADDTPTKLPIEAAGYLADFVRWKIALHIERDPALANLNLQNYRAGRRTLYSLSHQ